MGDQKVNLVDIEPIENLFLFNYENTAYSF